MLHIEPQWTLFSKSEGQVQVAGLIEKPPEIPSPQSKEMTCFFQVGAQTHFSVRFNRRKV